MAVRDDVAPAASNRVPVILRHRIYTPLLAVLGAVGVSAAVWVADPTTPGGVIPPCPIKHFLHIDCPGCGATRAVYSLLHGDLGAALHYNALAVVVLVLAVTAFARYVGGLWTGRRLTRWPRWRYAPLLLLVVLVAWSVVRNIPVEPFASLKV